MSLSVEHRLDVEQWGIGNAFLKGFMLKVMREVCQRVGITMPVVESQVFIAVVGVVWFCLHEEGLLLDATYRVDLYVMELLKAMYGLVDAPILPSIALRYFNINDTQGKPSRHNENSFF